MRLKDKGNTKDDESKCLHTHIQNEKGDKGKSKDVNAHTKHDCLIRSNPMDGQMDKQLQQHIPNSSNNKMLVLNVQHQHTKHDCLIRSNPMDGQMDKQLQQLQQIHF